MYRDIKAGKQCERAPANDSCRRNTAGWQRFPLVMLCNVLVPMHARPRVLLRPCTARVLCAVEASNTDLASKRFYQGGQMCVRLCHMGIWCGNTGKHGCETQSNVGQTQ